jgi:hypothetical protein
VEIVRWGIIGCGDVTEVKSGPGFQKARGSALVAVMRRDRAKAEDFARRHGVPRAYADAEALIADPEVDAVYIATLPSSHRALALQVAAAGKPCLVEKPMATTHAECVEMLDAFAARRTLLWVAYYRRALPRFLTVRDLLVSGDIGHVSSVHITVREPLAEGSAADQWRVDPPWPAEDFSWIWRRTAWIRRLSRRPDLGSGGLRDQLRRRLRRGGCHGRSVPDRKRRRRAGIWNFNAAAKSDAIVFTGSRGGCERRSSRTGTSWCSRARASRSIRCGALRTCTSPSFKLSLTSCAVKDDVSRPASARRVRRG